MGCNNIPIEKYNEAVGIMHHCKNQCEIEDNAIRARDVFLNANNSKLEDEYVKKIAKSCASLKV